MMRQIEYKFNDKTYYLAFTAEALFTVYDKFGYTSDILTTTGCLESTAEGWKNCCYLAALMASQGELQRRRMGYRPADMLDMETLRTGLRPAEVPELRLAVRQALEEGFRRELAPDEPEEVNLVLAAREEAEKKKEGAGATRIYYLASAARILGYGPETALLLAPGTYLDLIAALTPEKEDNDGD